jgi:hypothetical protein
MFSRVNSRHFLVAKPIDGKRSSPPPAWSGRVSMIDPDSAQQVGAEPLYLANNLVTTNF